MITVETVQFFLKTKQFTSLKISSVQFELISYSSVQFTHSLVLNRTLPIPITIPRRISEKIIFDKQKIQY